MIPRSLPPLLVAGSVVALGLALAADAPTGLRTPLGLWFLVACPGLALAPLLRLPEWASELTLVVALSLAVDVVVTMTMMYAGAWSSDAIFGVLAGIALAGSAAQLVIRGEEAEA